MTGLDAARAFRALPGRFADRLPAEELDELENLVDGGEWDDALELLVSSLGRRQVPVSAEERDLLRALLRPVRLPGRLLDQLTVTA